MNRTILAITAGSLSLLISACTSAMIKIGVIITTLFPVATLAAEYELQTLVPPSAFHGVHGMDFDAQGMLYAGDIMGMSVHKIDVATRATEVVVGPPPRQPTWLHNDVVVGTDGTIYLNSDTATAIYKVVPR